MRTLLFIYYLFVFCLKPEVFVVQVRSPIVCFLAGVHIHAFHLQIGYFKRNLSLGVCCFFSSFFRNLKEMLEHLQLSDGENIYKLSLLINVLMFGSISASRSLCRRVSRKIIGNVKFGHILLKAGW